ncbi:amino acid racemase, partial [Vibrio parahaemolyticus]|nr:amino acid racemase [Vibrio parahaemolyticus]
FSEIEKLQHQGKWEETASILSDAASLIEKGGADFILICTNTMHKVAPQIEASINIPILHIADATAELLREKGVQKVGLLGTQFTMEQDFYKGRLSDRYGLDVIIPDQDDRSKVHNIIYKELCQGEIKEESRTIYLQIIEKLKEQGAEAVILGCTEIALLVNQSHTDVTLL